MTASGGPSANHLPNFVLTSYGVRETHSPHPLLYSERPTHINNQLQSHHHTPSPLTTTTPHPANHVRTKSNIKVLPPRLRPLAPHPLPNPHPFDPRPQSPNRPAHGALLDEMHHLRRIHLQGAKIQRAQRNDGRKIPQYRDLPVLYPLYAVQRGDHVQDRSAGDGLRL